jgi:uncharacterized protein
MRHGETAGYFTPISKTKYTQLTTFRRDGTPVATPVHTAAEPDEPDVVYFRTWDTTGKAKRLRHTSAVLVAPSTLRGQAIRPAIRAEAHLLDGAASQHAASVLASKHPVLHGRLIPWYHRRRGWVTQQYRLDPPPPA